MADKNLSLGVTFTAKLDPTFDALVTKMKEKLKDVETAFNKVTKATDESRKGFITYNWKIKDIIKDMEKLLAVQARWYGAKFALFAGVEAPIQGVKTMIQYVNEIEKARGELLRWGATSGEVTDTMRRNVDLLLISIRRATTEFPVTLAELSKAMQAFAGAGVDYSVLQGMVEGVARLKVSFKEIDIEQWAIAVSGAFNIFKNSIKEGATEAEKMIIIFEKVLRAQAVGIARPESFAKVLQYMGPISKILGANLDQILAMTVAMSNLGGNISAVSRVASTMLQAMNTDKFMKMLDKMRVPYDKKKDLFSQLDIIIPSLSKAIGANETVVMGWFNALTKGMGRGEVRELVKFLMTYETTYKQLTATIAESIGGLKAASDIMSMAPSQQWVIFKNTLFEISKAINERIGPDLQKLTGTIIQIGSGILVAMDPTGIFADKLEKLGPAGRTAYNIMTSIINALKNIWTALTPVVALLGLFAEGLVKVINWLAEHNKLLEYLMTYLMIGLGAKLFTWLFSLRGIFIALAGFIDDLSLSVGGLGGAFGGLMMIIPLLIGKINPLIATLTGLLLIWTELRKALHPDTETERIQFSLGIAKADAKELRNQLDEARRDQTLIYSQTNLVKKGDLVSNDPSVMVYHTKWSAQSANAKALAERKKADDKVRILEEALKAIPPPVKKEKGAGSQPIPIQETKEKYKGYFNDIRNAEKASYAARLSEIRNNYATEDKLLENAYRNHLISEEDYQEAKRGLREKDGELFKKEIEKEREFLEKIYARNKRDIEEDSKMTSEEKSRRMEVLNARKEADLEGILTKEKAFQNKQRIDGDEDYHRRRNALIKDTIDAIKEQGEMERMQLNETLKAKSWAIEEERKVNRYRLETGSMSYVDYYNRELELSKDLLEEQKRVNREKLYSFLETNQAEMLKAGENKEAQAALDRDRNKYTQDALNDSAELHRKYAETVEEIHRKLNEDLEYIYEKKGWTAVVIKTVDRLKKEYNELGKTIDSLTRSIVSSAEGSLASIYSGMATGELSFSRAGDLERVNNQLAYNQAKEDEIKLKMEEIQSNNTLTESEKRTRTAALQAQLAQIEAQKKILEVQKQTISQTKTMSDYFKTWLKTLVDAMAQFLANQTVRYFINFLGQAFGSSGGGGATRSYGAAYGTGADRGAVWVHGGGVIGKDVLQQRQLDLLPRYHSGIGPNERLAVLQKNEGVFTPGQMRALGDLNRGDVNVQVNVENKSSQPVNAKSSGTEFDGKKYIISVILEDINKGGVLRGAMR